MGLGNKQTTTEFFGTSLNIIAGHFKKRVPEGTEGAESRKLTKGVNEGNTVWEVKYKSLSDSHIVSGKLDVSGQIKSASVEFDDGDEKFSVSFPLDSGYLSEFIMMLPNIDTSKAVDLELHEKRNKPDRYFLKVIQDGVTVKNHYISWKKDASGTPQYELHNGIPDMPWDDLEGKYDDRDRRRFLLEKFKEYFEGFEQSAPTRSEPPTETATDDFSDVDDLDVPF